MWTQKKSRLQKIIHELPKSATVIDIGCAGWLPATERPELKHIGIDCQKPVWIPERTQFFEANLERESIPLTSDIGDLVIASHVIEHLQNPVDFFGELVRVTKPGGVIYLEAPSDRAVKAPRWMPLGMSAMLSHFDDPTHTGRVWTPRAFYRLAIGYGCTTRDAQYLTSKWRKLIFPYKLVKGLVLSDDELTTGAYWDAIGWNCYALIEKPRTMSGSSEYVYFSMKGIKDGQQKRMEIINA